MLRDALYRRTLAIADMLAAIVALSVSIQLLGGERLTVGVVAMLPLVVLVGKAVGLYDRDEHLLHKTTLDEVPKLFHVATVYALITWLANGLLVHPDTVGRREVLGLWGILFVCLAGFRVVARACVEHIVPPERCVILGDRANAEWLRRKLHGAPSCRCSVEGHVPLRGGGRGTTTLPILSDLEGIGAALAEHEIDRVIIAPGDSDSDAELLDAIRLVKALGTKVTVLPRLFEVVGSSVEFDNVDGVTLLGIRRHGLTQSSRILKRGMDIVGATLFLLMMAPMLTIIAIAIKLDSAGPVFFRQRRIGCKNNEFDIIKFRTMIRDAEALKPELEHRNEAARGLFKIADDPRVTAVGRILRKTSLDELPQLFNVLRGEMSLVGPRPLVPDEDRQVLGHHRRRLLVKPGMTGLWQIFGSARIPLDEMVKIDYLYGANWSLWLDVKVLMRTVPYVLARRGL